MSDIKLTLTVEEATFTINTLGKLPYTQVSGLINNIQSQASTQLPDEEHAGKEITLSTTVEEATFIINTLGKLPYTQVNGLIHKIQSQASTQLPANGNGTAEEAAAVVNEQG